MLREYGELVDEEGELATLVNQKALEPAQTKDNVRIEIMLNAGLSADANIAINQGVDGVGLYRTEISFCSTIVSHPRTNRSLQYKSVLNTYPDKRVVMRTLDVGGIKLCLISQLKKITLSLDGERYPLYARSSRYFSNANKSHDESKCRSSKSQYFVPMVSGTQELDSALELIDRAHLELAKQDDENRYAGHWSHD